MYKVPFSIKYRPQIESGEYKVETGSGAEVKIVCWDADEYWPIVGIVNHSAVSYRANGSLPSKSSDFLTLFLITPEPELSELGSHLYSVFESVDCRDTNLTEEELIELTRKQEKVIFDLARKEIEKDLPRWKKCEDGNTNRLELEALCREAGSPIEIAFRANGYRIFLSDLEVLPKED